MQNSHGSRRRFAATHHEAVLYAATAVAAGHPSRRRAERGSLGMTYHATC
jgi:hypothetical protein